MNVRILEPVPSHEEIRADFNYRQHPIETNPPSSERPVSLHDLGIAGQAYYSRPNRLIPNPIDTLEKTPYLRASVAVELAKINDTLKTNQDIQNYFMQKYGRGVELYADDTLRPLDLQQELFDIHEPAAIATRLGKVTVSGIIVVDDEVLNGKRGIAKPIDDPNSPTPHSTGAAVDVKFRLVPEPYTLNYTSEDDFIDMGNIQGLVDTFTPDFYEIDAVERLKQLPHLSEEVRQKLINNWEEYRTLRRMFYYVMGGGMVDSDFEVNPREWWHWSMGDQMHAANRTIKTGSLITAQYGALDKI